MRAGLMPKTWFYFIALFAPIIVRVLLLNTTFVEWLWYEGYHDAYYLLAKFRINPQFQQYIAGWPLPVFTITVCAYWMMNDDQGIPDQFLMLPLAYVPFSIIGTVLVRGDFPSDLIMQPLVIVPFGYIYVIIWVVFLWVMEKCRLVL